MSIEACGVAFSSSGLTAILILCLRALFMHPTANDAVLYHFQLFFFSSPSFPHSPSPLSTAPKWESKLKEDIVLPLPIPHLAFASPHLGLHICCPPTILPLLQYDLSSKRNTPSLSIHSRKTLMFQNSMFQCVQTASGDNEASAMVMTICDRDVHNHQNNTLLFK